MSYMKKSEAVYMSYMNLKFPFVSLIIFIRSKFLLLFPHVTGAIENTPENGTVALRAALDNLFGAPRPLKPGPHLTRQRCPGPVYDRPSASRLVPSR